MLEENLSEVKGLDALREELRTLQKRRTIATDWNAATEGTRLLELQDLLRSNRTPLPPKLGKRQTEAGTVVDGKRQPKLTSQERTQIISANQNIRSPQRK